MAEVSQQGAQLHRGLRALDERFARADQVTDALTTEISNGLEELNRLRNDIQQKVATMQSQRRVIEKLREDLRACEEEHLAHLT